MIGLPGSRRSQRSGDSRATVDKRWAVRTNRIDSRVGLLRPTGPRRGHSGHRPIVGPMCLQPPVLPARVFLEVAGQRPGHSVCGILLDEQRMSRVERQLI